MRALIICAAAAFGCGNGATAPADGLPTPPSRQVPRDSIVMLDEGHNNYHTVAGRYAPFAALLATRGWSVRPYQGVFRADSLERGRILVIANALGARNAGGDWSLPTPSAFTAAEIAAVRAWVEGGGSLLLIADHMPFPGAAQELGAAFGAQFNNGFAFDTMLVSLPKTCLAPGEIDIFRRSDGTLRSHAIVDGGGAAERVDSVATFTGQAFQIGEGWEPLLTLSATSISLMPQRAWEFSAATPRVRVAGWAQGAVRRFGQGRVAVFGEAAMFSEQTCGANLPMGRNAPAAAHNGRLLLNLIGWLAT
jgi:hypothetical protein